MGLLLSVYLLSAITKTLYYLNEIQFLGLYIIQYHKFYNAVVKTIYIEDLVHNVGR